MRITPNDYWNPRAPSPKNCLPSALIVPPRNQNSIVMPLSENVPNLGRVGSQKSTGRRPLSHVVQKPERISVQQWSIPFKLDAKAGIRLITGSSSVTKKYLGLQAGMRC